jgi:hypothetical protein
MLSVMTEEPAATGQRTGPSDAVQHSRPYDEHAEPRIEQTARASDSSSVYQVGGEILLSPESAALVAAITIFGKAFLETLGQRAGDGAANIPRQVFDLVSARKRRTGKTEVHLGTDSDEAATIAVTADTPDEARLALLDLDVTADELRGKLLRWDGSASAWRPDDDQ